jgi:hypothetical protein
VIDSPHLQAALGHCSLAIKEILEELELVEESGVVIFLNHSPSAAPLCASKSGHRHLLCPPERWCEESESEETESKKRNT